MSDTIEVFISYSRQDKELRDRLLSHLRPLEREGIISWHDRQILPGTEWDEEIKARLNAADIILLLISADFLNTDYCNQVEIPEALRRHEAGEATVMPVILRACGWKYTPLAAIQAYPEKAKPIVSWQYVDDAYTNVVDAVYLAATEIKKRRGQQQTAEDERRRQEEREQEAARKQDEQQADEQERLRQEQVRQKQAADRLRQQELERQQQAQPIDTDDLSSERNIDYTQLRNLLKAGQWKEADQETAQRMCEAMGRQKEGWLRIEDIQQFPCADLRTIDQLWVKCSNGKFGFSVQRKIWQKHGSPTKYNRQFENFGIEVGWKTKSRMGIGSEWKKYSDLAFDTSAMIGHLPSLMAEDNEGQRQTAYIPSLVSCNSNPAISTVVGFLSGGLVADLAMVTRVVVQTQRSFFVGYAYFLFLRAKTCTVAYGSFSRF